MPHPDLWDHNLHFNKILVSTLFWAAWPRTPAVKFRAGRLYPLFSSKCWMQQVLDAYWASTLCGLYGWHQINEHPALIVTLSLLTYLSHLISFTPLGEPLVLLRPSLSTRIPTISLLQGPPAMQLSSDLPHPAPCLWSRCLHGQLLVFSTSLKFSSDPAIPQPLLSQPWILLSKWRLLMLSSLFPPPLPVLTSPILLSHLRAPLLSGPPFNAASWFSPPLTPSGAYSEQLPLLSTFSLIVIQVLFSPHLKTRFVFLVLKNCIGLGNPSRYQPTHFFLHMLPNSGKSPLHSPPALPDSYASQNPLKSSRCASSSIETADCRSPMTSQLPNPIDWLVCSVPLWPLCSITWLVSSSSWLPDMRPS